MTDARNKSKSKVLSLHFPTWKNLAIMFGFGFLSDKPNSETIKIYLIKKIAP